MINKAPFIEINCDEKACWEGWKEIGRELNRRIELLKKKKAIIVIECFQGTYADINLHALKSQLKVSTTCRTRDLFKDERHIRDLVAQSLSFKNQTARLTTHTIYDYFDQEKLHALKSNIDQIQEGLMLIHGIGASEVVSADISIYSDMSRWEILQRFRRNDISNIGVKNQEDHPEKQHQWSYFVDWRICDRIKKRLIPGCQYFMESNNWQMPKLANAEIVRKGFDQAARQPFFMAPFFDPELWDSQPITDFKQEDFEWGFNCDIEEDNILLKIGNSLFETPAINLVYHNASELLGESIYRKHGFDVPAKLNFLDSTEDSNSLSLEIYPGPDHLKDYHAIHCPQVENYYIMDARKKARMYVNLRDGVSPDLFVNTIKHQKPSEITNLMDHISLEKHDHLTLCQQTLHGDGQQAMMLHISTAPQIFKTIVYNDKKGHSSLSPSAEALLEEVCQKGPQKIFKNHLKVEGSQMREEILSPNENAQLRISRIWFEEELKLESSRVFNMFNLIEGEEIIIESQSSDFRPFSVHYAETFFIPAAIKPYVIKVSGKSRTGLLRVMPTI